MRNAVRCCKCDTVIESTYRHDFQTCPCGSVSVDGGQDYKRRLYTKGVDYEELED